MSERERERKRERENKKLQTADLQPCCLVRLKLRSAFV